MMVGLMPPLGSVCTRAKNIKNQAVVNEDADQRTLLRKYERELRKLRAELTRRNKELVDKRHLLEVGPLIAATLSSTLFTWVHGYGPIMKSCLLITFKELVNSQPYQQAACHPCGLQLQYRLILNPVVWRVI